MIGPPTTPLLHGKDVCRCRILFLSLFFSTHGVKKKQASWSGETRLGSRVCHQRPQQPHNGCPAGEKHPFTSFQVVWSISLVSVVVQVLNNPHHALFSCLEKVIKNDATRVPKISHHALYWRADHFRLLGM